ncbi:MAG TPA: hypothetical protein VHY81_12585 [Acidimicrobiales bacterium]|nr:hypothetical protein [Acidimicrobiales bacterium]
MMRFGSWKRAACALAGAVALAGPVVGLAAVSAPAGALPPPLTSSTNTISFQATTLGDFSLGSTFTLTNGSTMTDTISGSTGFVITGAGANDYTGIPETNCNVDASGNITIAGNGGQCTFDNLFTPGALGARPATLQILDSLNSGVVITFSGTGAIGYYQVSSSGQVAHFGDAAFYGDASNVHLNRPIEGIAQTGDNGGYWLVADDGGIFNYGDAGFFGSAGGLPLNKPIVGMAATTDGGGYWLVASDGGIFAYGDAQFYGSTGGLPLNKPIVGMAPTPDGGGYWLVASDGGIFAYGDAQFHGSTGAIKLNKPIVGMAPMPDGGGYWLVASDGGIFAYGNAQFYGSTGALHLVQPIVGMTAMPDGSGYWFSAADGGLFNYGGAPFYGAANSQGIGNVVAMTTDGAPTLQAFLDQPAARSHGTVQRPSWGVLPHGPRSAGP